MGLFSKKTTTSEILKNKDFIAKMAADVDVLISLMEEVDEPAIIDGLREVQDEIKYLNPSNNPRVIAVDNTINNRLQDIKLAIVKGRKILDYSDVQGIIDELLSDVIVTRKSKENS